MARYTYFQVHTRFEHEPPVKRWEKYLSQQRVIEPGLRFRVEHSAYQDESLAVTSLAHPNERIFADPAGINEGTSFVKALLANSTEVDPNVWELLDELKVDQPTLINYLLAKRRRPVDRAFMQNVKAWGEKQVRRGAE